MAEPAPRRSGLLADGLDRGVHEIRDRDRVDEIAVNTLDGPKGQLIGVELVVHRRFDADREDPSDVVALEVAEEDGLRGGTVRHAGVLVDGAAEQRLGLTKLVARLPKK